MVLKRIIVNKHNIRHNAQKDFDPLADHESRPVMSVKRAGHGTDAAIGYDTTIACPKCTAHVGTFVYRPFKPMNCGATLWFETHGIVQIQTTIEANEWRLIL